MIDSSVINEYLEDVFPDRPLRPDLSLMPTIVRMEDLGLQGRWADLPRVTDWYGRLQARPAFAITHYSGTRVIGPSC